MGDLPTWAQIAIAVFGTGGGGAAIVKLVREAMRSQKSKDMDSGLHDIHEIYIELQELLRDTVADRILVLKSENGGGLPMPGSEVKSSVVYEVFSGDAISLRETWQRVPIDQQYSEVLSVLSAGQWVWRRGDRLAERSVLRDLVEPEVALLVFARVCASANALWYISLHVRSVDEIPEAERARIRNAIYRLRVLFGRHQSLVKTESKE